MNKVGQWVTGTRAFLEEVRVELAKCSWPERSELLESTVVVIVSCLLLATFVGISDGLLMQLMGLIIR